MTGPAARSDRVSPFTRGLALGVLPFLVVASVLLYLLPGSTEQLFAWTIEPPLTAMLLGSAYLGGIWFFVRVLITRQWHTVRYGFPAVLVFATALGVATLLHLDRFHHGHISFITWGVVYAVTPVAVLVAAVRNWRADSRGCQEGDTSVPVALRVLLVLCGAGALLCGVSLYAVPEVFVSSWAWELTPLTARVVGAVLTLPGMVNLWLLVDRRWSSFRSILQAQIFSLLFMLLAVAISVGSLEWDRPAAPGFVAALGSSLVLYVATYLWCRRRVGADGSAVRRAEPS